MNRTLTLLAAAVAGLALTGSTVAAPAATPKLTGSVGPGFTITLKKGTAKVTKLKHGKYTFVIKDKSNIHNFHLKGPGVNKKTGVGFVGTSTWKVKLKAGKYRYVCDPHVSTMHGSFKVK